jgi:hypothetical protein
LTWTPALRSSRHGHPQRQAEPAHSIDSECRRMKAAASRPSLRSRDCLGSRGQADAHLRKIGATLTLGCRRFTLTSRATIRRQAQWWRSSSPQPSAR